MVWNWTAYALPFFAAAGVCLFVARSALQRPSREAVWFALLLAAATVWAAGYGFEILSEPLAQKLLWARVQYVGIVLVPVLWFVFALQYSGRHPRPGIPLLAVLLAIPAVTLMLLLSPSDALVWRQAELGAGPGFSTLRVVYGPWFWVHTTYSYLLWGASAVILLPAMRQSPHIYRRQAPAVAVAMISPWLLNVLYVTRVVAVDTTPLGFAIGGLAAFWALTRQQFLEVMPVTRSRVVEALRDGVVVLDAEERIVDFNSAAEKVLRLPASALIGRDFDEAVSRRVKLRPLTGEGNELQLEAEIPAGRETRCFELRSWPLQDGRNRDNGRMIIFREITGRKEVEEALRASEARLRVVIEQMPAVLWTTDSELRVTQVLGAGLQQLCMDAEAVLGSEVAELFEVDEEHVAVASHRSTLEGMPSTFSTRWRGRDFDCHVEPLIDRHGAAAGIIGVGLDVTERQDLEDQLRQSQKMEAIGRMAGGVAHDFNNLLTAVAGYAQLAREDLDALGASGWPVTNLRRDLDAIRHASERATSITAQLLAFSRRQVLQPRLLKLDETIDVMYPMLHRLIGGHIELVTSFDPDCHAVEVDPVQVEQVVINLLLNSRDAMPGGGRISVEVTNTELQEGRAAGYDTVEPGEYVVLSVADDGVGMDEDTQAHLFEPFFTTKDEGRGTGLGMSTVYGIVRQTGGYIDVVSELGKGTTVRIYLPAVPGAEVGPVAAAVEADTGALRGDETVLLVEDEEMVRELGSRVLNSHGYRVLEAEDGHEALDVCCHHEGPVHLVVTDVVMPGMNGSDLAARVAEIMPDASILFISGYTGGALVEHGVLEDGTNFLQKPFSPESFIRTVREILDARD